MSILIRAVYIAFPELDSVLPFAVKTVILNSPWFLFGMVLTIVPNKNSNLMKVISLILLLIGIGVSAFFYQEENNSKAIQFGLGILFVISIIFLFKSIDWSKLDSVISKLSEYFMPVFLMHTIFAACMRTVLFKSGVQSLGIHIIVGFISSFVFPIITYEIAKKHWLLLFFIEPGKALKMRGKSKCLNTKD